MSAERGIIRRFIKREINRQGFENHTNKYSMNKAYLHLRYGNQNITLQPLSKLKEKIIKEGRRIEYGN